MAAEGSPSLRPPDRVRRRPGELRAARDECSSPADHDHHGGTDHDDLGTRHHDDRGTGYHDYGSRHHDDGSPHHDDQSASEYDDIASDHDDDEGLDIVELQDL